MQLRAERENESLDVAPFSDSFYERNAKKGTVVPRGIPKPPKSFKSKDLPGSNNAGLFE